MINLRHIPHAKRANVLAALDQLVQTDLLYFPPEVLGELERHVEKSNVASVWSKQNAPKATKYGHLFEQAKAVLATIPNLIDPTKVSAVDPADPYVIALAQGLANDGYTPTIITDDFRTIPTKTSLSAAAGVFGIPDVPLMVFLQTQHIL